MVAGFIKICEILVRTFTLKAVIYQLLIAMNFVIKSS